MKQIPLPISWLSSIIRLISVADPYLQIRGWGWGAVMQRRGRSYKKKFSALRASVWSKNKGGGSGPLPQDPSLPFLEVILRIKRRPVLHLLFNENSFSNPHL